MRVLLALLFGLVASVLALPAPFKRVVVQYPEGTPASVVQTAIAEIKKDGGIITHEYSDYYVASCTIPILTATLALFKGFAAKISEVTLNKISALAETYVPVIENDYIVHTDGSTTADEQ